jgi:hypothetical protein
VLGATRRCSGNYNLYGLLRQKVIPIFRYLGVGFCLFLGGWILMFENSRT